MQAPFFFLLPARASRIHRDANPCTQTQPRLRNCALPRQSTFVPHLREIRECAEYSRKRSQGNHMPPLEPTNDDPILSLRQPESSTSTVHLRLVPPTDPRVIAYHFAEL